MLKQARLSLSSNLLLYHHSGEVWTCDQEYATEGVGYAVQSARVVGRQVDETELQDNTNTSHVNPDIGTGMQGCARYMKFGSAIPIQDTGSVSKEQQNVSLV